MCHKMITAFFFVCTDPNAEDVPGLTDQHKYSFLLGLSITKQIKSTPSFNRETREKSR